MRLHFAGTLLYRFLLQAPDVVRYYSDAGILPRGLELIYFRTYLRFSVLDLSGDPRFVIAVYLAFIACLICMLLGAAPRLSTIASTLLAYSFYERNSFSVAGGDTILRLVGFILMVSPGIEAFSLWRLRDQWHHWKATGHLLPPLLMPMWPWRLLLWQAFLTYLTSLWSKLLGGMWLNGTILADVLQHEHFSRFAGTWAANALSALTRPLTYLVLAVEAAWALLLLPQRWTWDRLRLTRGGRLRRILLAASFLFHLGIEITLIVGIFFYAMVTLLVGLLQGEDFDAIRAWFNRKRTGKMTVLYDGHCGLCRRSVFILTILDNLHRVRFTDYHDAFALEAVAPDLALADLERTMHVRAPNGLTWEGFHAFRALTWHLPVLWPLAPILYLPGVPWIGKRVYARIAARRLNCNHEFCAL